MTSVVLFLTLTGYINIITAADFLAAFMYPFFILFILLAVILTEVPNHKTRYYVLGFIQCFIAVSIGFSFKANMDLGQSINLGWPYFVIILFMESLLYYIIFWWESKYEKIEPKVGTETMIGDTAKVISWNGKSGRVFHEGESWKAVSTEKVEMLKGEEVTITHVDVLTITIKKL